MDNVAAPTGKLDGWPPKEHPRPPPKSIFTGHVSLDKRAPVVTLLGWACEDRPDGNPECRVGVFESLWVGETGSFRGLACAMGGEGVELWPEP